MNSIQRSPQLKSPVAKPAVRTKVPFEKGYSQMDWLKLTRTHLDLTVQDEDLLKMFPKPYFYPFDEPEDEVGEDNSSRLSSNMSSVSGSKE
ncbi:hypothetical protein HN51_001482 [Arachis hypogaea]